MMSRSIWSDNSATVGASKTAEQRELDPEGVADARDELDTEERVAAEQEEIVVDADALEAEHRGDDRGQPLLNRRQRAEVVGPRAHVVGRVGLRQSGRIDLAVRGQRERRDPHEGRRHHVLRQVFPEEGLQRIGGYVVPRRRHDIGHQATVPGALLAGGDMARPDGGMPVQHGDDLARFDAEAANLHLVVEATETFDGAIRQIAGQVARLIEPRAGGRRRMGRAGNARRSGRGD